MKIIDYDISGEGVAKEEGKVYFVKNALLNEEVTVEILAEEKNFVRAKSKVIKNENPNRAVPQCPYFFKCGGCQLEHMNKCESLLFKQNLICNTLKKIAGIDVRVEETVASDKDYHYRNKSVFVAKVYDGGTHFGMYEEGSKNFVEIKKCLLASDGINEMLFFVAQFFEDKPERNLKHLMLRQIDDQILLTFVAQGKLNYLDSFLTIFKANNFNGGVYLNFNSSDEEILSGNFQHVYGLKNLTLIEDGVAQKIYPASFLQVNTFIKEKLYQKVISFVNVGDEVVDAYCGSGYLTYLISTKAKSVVGIESVPAAIKAAKQLALSKKQTNLKFVLGDVNDVLKGQLNKTHLPTIILDPPRKGCGKKVLTMLADAMAKRIVYISCSPISLAKDIKLLLSYGYSVKFTQGYDMFPNTANVETLMVLEKN